VAFGISLLLDGIASLVNRQAQVFDGRKALRPSSR
jgi:hypothetical protein